MVSVPGKKKVPFEFDRIFAVPGKKPTGAEGGWTPGKKYHTTLFVENENSSIQNFNKE